MFSSSSDFYIFLAIIAIIYTTPFIYTLITIYGIFKKREQIIFIKIILSVNVLIIVNILYYFFSPNSLPYSSHTIFFITMGLITFLPASLSLLINLPKKVDIYTYIILFSLSLCVYNSYCFSEKLKQDHRAMVFSALEQGNIQKLQQVFNDECSNNSITFDYLNEMAEVETYPAKSFAFMLDCMAGSTETKHVPFQFIIFYKNALLRENTNTALLNLLYADYYHKLNESDKNNLVEEITSEINNRYSAKNTWFVERFNFLIKKHPELTNYIKIDEQDIINAIDYGNITFINYAFPYYSTKNENLLLATSVLSHADEKIMKKIEENKNFLNIELLSSDHHVWRNSKIDLLSYIFRYGSENLIIWLLSRGMDDTATFDYQESYVNSTNDQKEYSCRNYLMDHIRDNPEISHENKWSIRTVLELRSNCPSR